MSTTTVVGKLVFKETGPVLCSGMNWTNDFSEKEKAMMQKYPYQDFSRPDPMWAIGWRACQNMAVVSEVISDHRPGAFIQILAWCEDHQHWEPKNGTRS